MDTIHTAFRVLVPKPEDRTPLTWSTFHHTITNLVPLIYMGYLARRPDTHLLRILVFPIVVALTLRGSFGYIWINPNLNLYNWAEALWGFTVIGKALDLAIAKDGRWKVGERRLGELETPAITQRGDLDASHEKSAKKRPGRGIFPLWFVDSTELLCSLRGLGWDWGKDVYVPKETRPLEKGPFLRATFVLFLKSFLILDFIDSTVKLIPRVGTPEGGSMFFPELPPFQRYALSTFIHFNTGTGLVVGFYMIYSLFTLIGVAVLDHSPSSWPPVMDQPFSSDSLTIFWAKRWHQIFRQTFFVFGGYLLHLVFGRVGLIVGTFIASGLYHELSMYAMGRGLDMHVPLFFSFMGVLVLGERAFKVVTGRRVRGWPGMVWTYFCIVVLGQPCVDSWHRRGMAGGMIIPPFLSPFRLWVFPLIRTVFLISRPLLGHLIAFVDTHGSKLGLSLEWVLSHPIATS